jgi:hypothetical protein
MFFGNNEQCVQARRESRLPNVVDEEPIEKSRRERLGKFKSHDSRVAESSRLSYLVKNAISQGLGRRSYPRHNRTARP